MARLIRTSRWLVAAVALLAACTPLPVPAPAPNLVPPPAPAVEVMPTPAPAPAPPETLPAATPAPPVVPAPQPAPPPPIAEPTPPPKPQVAAVVPTQAAAPALVEPNPCEGGSRQPALPGPGSPGAQDFFRSFRAPLAPAPLYAPPGQRQVGLQAGHWRNDEVPAELGRLQGGSAGGGKAEWEVNLDVARRTAALLEAAGVTVDVLPATVPERYKAHVFIALHADGDAAGAMSGFKIARPGFSSIPDVDDRLVDTLNDAYGAATALPRDDEHISLRMRYYYAFNSRRFCHAVAPGVPQAIVEMGFMTSAADRRLLIGDPDRLAGGLAEGIRAFLRTLP